ncbi:MAG: pantetheine-phosphate adenylyltransferase [Chloroflexi bacterium]|mgnify:CR=1 FL=1|nr:pantetheine-phosphate adenylyltransferase [Chloroflexota bacterium]|tara:strand:+ start:480 stop:968 length:489 start_codon:yes stop_codon:yes gene_type:complete
MNAIYPGTFDPVTNGHVDIAERSAKIFNQLIIAVIKSPNKKTLFNCDERIEMITKSINHIKNVKVMKYSGLTVNFAKKTNSEVIVRGLRITSDFEYESEMALVNRRMEKSIETVCLFSSLENQILSSSRVKEIASLGANISTLVPKNVCIPLLTKLKNHDYK